MLMLFPFKKSNQKCPRSGFALELMQLISKALSVSP